MQNRFSRTTFIKCDTVAQLYEVAKIAESEGYTRYAFDTIHSFEQGYCYLSLYSEQERLFSNYMQSDITKGDTIISFADFINQQPEKPELKGKTLDTLTVGDLEDNFGLLNPSPTEPNAPIKDNGESERTISWASNYEHKEPARSPEHVYDELASMNISGTCTSKEKVHVWSDEDMKAAYRAGKSCHYAINPYFDSWLKDYKDKQ